LSRRGFRINRLTQATLLVLLGVISLSFSPSLTLLFIIPIFGWYIWRYHTRISELEKRLAALEPHPPPKPEEGTPSP
jgi:hypothetical protein